MGDQAEQIVMAIGRLWAPRFLVCICYVEHFAFHPLQRRQTSCWGLRTGHRLGVDTEQIRCRREGGIDRVSAAARSCPMLLTGGINSTM